MAPVSKWEAEASVRELRHVLSVYEEVDLPPGSRLAEQLERARWAVAAYDALDRHLEASTGGTEHRAA